MLSVLLVNINVPYLHLGVSELVLILELDTHLPVLVCNISAEISSV